MHLNSGKLDLLVVGFLHHSPARCHRYCGTRIDGKPNIPALVDITARAIDNDPADSFRLRSQRQESAPTRSIGSSAIIDHNHVPGLSRVDGQRAKMLFWFVQTHRFDFHGYSTANNLRARPHRADTIRCPRQSQTIHAVGHRAGIKLQQAFNDRFPCHLDFASVTNHDIDS